jgi:colicin import membrane protein
MRPPKYPLELLAEVRKRAVDAAVRRLASAVKARDAAARARQAAEDARREHERAAARVREGERDALERGELRAADLARGETWASRIAAERARLSAGVDRAKSAEAEASDGQLKAQAGVASRRSEADVVEKDRSRWDDARRKAAEAREEDVASEAWRPKR